ncbi:hypothetical protein E4U36_008437 [Claviceps purpurea]|nr:hypothetical protein E4U36_008437 [Claviceps purpurea]KAG6227115.1 hypothetical protein E4U26_001895 [Claviceps purpurea]
MSANKLLRFLTTTQVNKLYNTHFSNARLAQPTQPVYLESAIHSPRQHKRYGENDVFRLTGVLAQKIILNHAYQDGNKRTPLLAADMFLKINGYQLHKRLFYGNKTEKELEDAHASIGMSKYWCAYC